MAQVRIGGLAAHLDAPHVVAEVLVLGDGRRLDGPREAGPAAAGIELVLRAEERLAAHHVHVDAGCKQVVILVREGALGAALLRDAILLGAQALLQLGIRSLAVAGHIKAPAHGGGCRRIARRLARQRLVSLAHVNMAIAVGVLGQIVLVIFLGLVEVLQRQVLHHQRAAVLLLQRIQRLLDGGLVSRIRVVDARAVLCTAVIALLVQAGGIDDAEVVLQDVGQAQAVGVIGHLHRLGMARATDHVLVAGVLRAPIGIARHGIHHARDALEIGFHAPEAAAGQIDGPGIHDFR